MPNDPPGEVVKNDEEKSEAIKRPGLHPTPMFGPIEHQLLLVVAEEEEETTRTTKLLSAKLPAKSKSIDERIGWKIRGSLIMGPNGQSVSFKTISSVSMLSRPVPSNSKLQAQPFLQSSDEQNPLRRLWGERFPGAFHGWFKPRLLNLRRRRPSRHPARGRRYRAS